MDIFENTIFQEYDSLFLIAFPISIYLSIYTWSLKKVTIDLWDGQIYAKHLCYKEENSIHGH